MFNTADRPQKKKPVFTSFTPVTLPALRPLTHAPKIMPPMVGAKNQPNCCSFNFSMSSTKAGAEAMYRNSAPKLKVPASASRRKRPLPSMWR